MTNDERAFLAQVALGWFTANGDGTIWRNAEFTGGGVPTLKWVEPRRAERSASEEDGYIRVMFHDSGERLMVQAHRIIWMVVNRADIPAPLEVNHKDGVKYHNHPDNLELLTRPENVKHAIHVLGRKPKAQNGTANTFAKLTDQQVMEIRALWASQTMSQRQIAERFGLKQATISCIVTGKTWRHLASTG